MIVNWLSEEQLAGMKPHDLLTLLEGFGTLPTPGIGAACARFENAIIRTSSRPWSKRTRHLY